MRYRHFEFWKTEIVRTEQLVHQNRSAAAGLLTTYASSSWLAKDAASRWFSTAIAAASLGAVAGSTVTRTSGWLSPAAACPQRQRRRGVRAYPMSCLARTRHFRWQAPTFAPLLSPLGARRRGSGGAGGRECAQNAARSIRNAVIILKHLLLKKASQRLMAKPMAEVITLWRGDEGERDRGGERSRELLCMPKIAPACFMELAAACQQLLAPLLLSSLE